MKNKLFKTMTYAMLVTTGVGFIAPLTQPLSVFAEEKTEVKSESLDLTKAIDDAKMEIRFIIINRFKKKHQRKLLKNCLRLVNKRNNVILRLLHYYRL